MLTLAEKILFIIAVLGSLYFAYITFGQMIKVVRRGQGQLRLDQIPERLRMGLAALVGQGRILRHRWVVWSCTLTMRINREGFKRVNLGFH